MCGLWASAGDSAGGSEIGHAALEAMRHRGPDGRDLLTTQVAHQPVQLGHVRLAIIDIGPQSDQPMTSPCGRYSMVYNGEIYNYRELRTLLENDGAWTFRTQSDTEVLLAGYATMGPKILDLVDGMFAFVILDREEERLFLARDPFGIKPLYYHRGKRTFFAASEIRPLLLVPTVTRTLDSERALSYLRSGQIGEGSTTFFADIHQIPAAHCASLDLQTHTWVCQRYWRAPIAPQPRSFPDAVEHIRSLFLRSIALHLRSDVPVGAALSGGIDSSSILCAMRHHLGDGPLHAFSFIAPGTPFDESQYMEQAATAAGATLHRFEASGADLLRDLDPLILTQEEPFASTSIYAQYRVMRLARETGIKVMLDGQGGDEVFAGYSPFYAARIGALLRRGRLGAAIAFARMLSQLPSVSARQLGRDTLGLLLPGPVRTALRRAGKSAPGPVWMNPAWLAEHSALRPPVASDDRRRLLQSRLRASLETDVLPSLLRYEDRNSMAFSLESRVPFLTRDLVSAAYSLPDDCLIATGDGTTKSVFREAMRGLTPSTILDRKDKVGFNTPESDWIAHLVPHLKTWVNDASPKQFPMLSLPAVAEQINQCNASRTLRPDVWRAINFIRWATLFDITP